jgi:hypothetical protein
VGEKRDSMAFLIFREQRRTWTQIRSIKLGQTIASYVQRKISDSAFKDVLKWGISEQELLAIEAKEFRDGKHHLVIDLKPAAKQNLSLYQVQHIWGWTTRDWTPIALRLRPLFVDFKVQDATEAKKQFELPSDKQLAEIGSPVHEFLYFWHKNPANTWNWGLVGHVNGALLWPDVFDYFVERITGYGHTGLS